MSHPQFIVIEKCDKKAFSKTTMTKRKVKLFSIFFVRSVYIARVTSGAIDRVRVLLGARNLGAIARLRNSKEKATFNLDLADFVRNALYEGFSRELN